MFYQVPEELCARTGGTDRQGQDVYRNLGKATRLDQLPPKEKLSLRIKNLFTWFTWLLFQTFERIPTFPQMLEELQLLPDFQESIDFSPSFSRKKFNQFPNFQENIDFFSKFSRKVELVSQILEESSTRSKFSGECQLFPNFEEESIRFQIGSSTCSKLSGKYRLFFPDFREKLNSLQIFRRISTSSPASREKLNLF